MTRTEFGVDKRQSSKGKAYFVGRVVWRWKIISLTESKSWRIVQCVCENKTVRRVRWRHLFDGNQRSCGCIKHAGSHGRCQSPFYALWDSVKNRCYRKKATGYHLYGGRAGTPIKMCDTWYNNPVSFVRWCEQTHPGLKGLSLERLDNSKDYSPDNCKWATRKQQQRNMRSNRMVRTPKGPMCVAEAIEVFGINGSTLRKRLRMNWPLERLFESVNKKHSTTLGRKRK